MRAALAAVLLAACSQPAKAPAEPVVGCSASTPSLCSQEQLQGRAAAPVDAPGPSEDEKLAAIQKAMNELDEAAQGCWALAATERFDIEGELRVLVEIGAAASKTQVVSDTARNAKLAGCLAQLLAQYRWAPPLHGQAIQLPFSFKAPHGQSVIDRRLVESKGQGNISVAVLLDESNSGNGAASVLEVAIAPRASTGMRVAERPELWYFLGDAEVKSKAGKAPIKSTRVAAGSMMFVPKGAAREVIAAVPDMHAVIVMVPGGREGTARAGALPTVEGTGTGAPLMLATGTKAGPAMIFLEPAVLKTAPLAASILELPAAASVPEHVHANETELLYVLDGSGTMTVAGQAVAVTSTSVIQIPPNTKHAFTATANVRALQIYTPAGPEQRFKKKPK